MPVYDTTSLSAGGDGPRLDGYAVDNDVGSGVRAYPGSEQADPASADDARDPWGQGASNATDPDSVQGSDAAQVRHDSGTMLHAPSISTTNA